jgi:hypothetical protein
MQPPRERWPDGHARSVTRTADLCPVDESDCEGCAGGANRLVRRHEPVAVKSTETGDLY